MRLYKDIKKFGVPKVEEKFGVIKVEKLKGLKS